MPLSSLRTLPFIFAFVATARVHAFTHDGACSAEPSFGATLLQHRISHESQDDNSAVDGGERFPQLLNASGNDLYGALNLRPSPFKIMGKAKHNSRGTLTSKKYSESEKKRLRDKGLLLTCWSSFSGTAQKALDMMCDDSCPFLVEEVVHKRYCSFQCVPATECAKLSPSTPIADVDWGICRSCMVNGCAECINDGSYSCSKCATGYKLHEGICYGMFSLSSALKALTFVAIGVLLTLTVVWLLDLRFRPVTNTNVLERALQARECSKLRMPEGESEVFESSDQLWPLSTSLCATSVAGPGLVLHFRFQLAVIIWAICVAAAWASVAYVYDHDLFILGHREASTPLERCVVIHWGYEKQQALRPLKEFLVFSIYLGSFALALIFAVCQVRQFRALKASAPTLTNFALECVGLPPLNGSEDVENELKEAIEDATGETVIGISVCWDYQSHAELIEAAHRNELWQIENNGKRMRFDSSMDDISVLGHRQMFAWATTRFQKMEEKLIPCLLDDAPESGDEYFDDNLKQVLRELQSSNRAFVIFPTTESRERALRYAERNQLGRSFSTNHTQISFRDGSFTLIEAPHEPYEILWRNYELGSNRAIVLRLCVGVLCTVAALALWALLFYVPFNYYVLSSVYASEGESIGILTFAAFSSAVLLGNSVLFWFCSDVANRAGFHSNHAREVTYSVMYTVACFFNVLLDLSCAYIVLFKVMADKGVRTHDGLPLAEVTSFQSRFETYGMQRALGENLMGYAFPSTFLLPFLLEPFFSHYLPFEITKLIVGSHEMIRDADAEVYLAYNRFDLSRYPDICVDVTIASLVFLFPGGYVVEMFCALAGSHLFVFCWDKYRLLRMSQKCTFTRWNVDLCCQALLAVPCGILLACVLNMHLHAEPRLLRRTTACIVACIGHIIIHCLLLAVIAHCCGRRLTEEVQHASYEEVAIHTPCNWFSANPVHYLRSRHIHTRHRSKTNIGFIKRRRHSSDSVDLAG